MLSCRSLPAAMTASMRLQARFEPGRLASVAAIAEIVSALSVSRPSLATMTASPSRSGVACSGASISAISKPWSAEDSRCGLPATLWSLFSIRSSPSRFDQTRSGESPTLMRHRPSAVTAAAVSVVPMSYSFGSCSHRTPMASFAACTAASIRWGTIEPAGQPVRYSCMNASAAVFAATSP